MTNHYDQLLLFEDPFEVKLLRRMEKMEVQQDKYRKSQFAKIGTLQKAYDQLSFEFETLKAAICKTALHEPKISCEILHLSAMK